MTSSGMLRRVALVRTTRNIPEEAILHIYKVIIYLVLLFHSFFLSVSTFVIIYLISLITYYFPSYTIICL
jgi:hypothetical protein